MSKEDKKLIYAPKSKITKDSITIYGAGKFGEESLVLYPVRAAILMSELWIFINKSVENKL